VTLAEAAQSARAAEPGPFAASDGPPPGRVLRQAALIFLAYAILQVLINGIVLDESVIASQVLLGQTRYEAGHPHAIYYTQAYSLSHYLAALASWLHVSDAMISASRNVLGLFVSLFAAFAVAYVLTRDAVWGYVAAALLVAEANLRLVGNYPMPAFPGMYSNGQIGLHVGLLTLAFTLGGMWRSSGLLLGLLPSIHAMFALVLWPFAGLFFLARGLHKDAEARRRILLWGGVGLAVCVLLYVAIRLMADHRPPIAPYDVAGSGELIREQFTRWTDRHRTLLPAASFPYLANAAAFLVVGGLLWWRARVNDSPVRAQCGWLLGFGALVWSYIYGTWLLQMLTGSLPDIVLLTMPSRYSNLSAALLLPMTAAALSAGADGLDARRRALVLAAVGALLLVGALAAADVLTFARTRSIFSRNVLFLLLSLILACEWLGALGRQRIAAGIAFLVLTGVLATYLPASGIVLYVVAVAVGGVLILRWAPALAPVAAFADRLGRIAPARIVLPGALLLALAAMPGRTADPISLGNTRVDMQTAETRALDAWLDANAAPDAPVLTTFLPNPELQAKTRQPVLFEHKTLWMMTYMPDLAPAIGMMARDLYGVDYENLPWLETACGGARVGTYCDAWSRDWEQRSPEQWRRLREKYRFHLVLASSTTPLHLPVAVAGRRWTLYTIP